MYDDRVDRRYAGPTEHTYSRTECPTAAGNVVNDHRTRSCGQYRKTNLDTLITKPLLVSDDPGTTRRLGDRPYPRLRFCIGADEKRSRPCLPHPAGDGGCRGEGLRTWRDNVAQTYGSMQMRFDREHAIKGTV
jgi:hypothetical protein